MRKRIGRDKPEQRGAEAETQMWCEEPVWSEETLKSDIMEIPLSYTRITKMTCQDKPRQNVWIFKVKMETQSYQHSLGRESTGCLGREERKKRKGCPQPCPFQESNGKQWQFYLSQKEKAVVAQQCPVELHWPFMSRSCTDIPRQARAVSTCECTLLPAKGKWTLERGAFTSSQLHRAGDHKQVISAQIAYIDLSFQRK